MKKLLLSLLAVLASFTFLLAQSPLKKIQPDFWFAGMKNSELQILLYGERISDWNVKVSDASITITRIIKTENPNYLFLYLETRSAKPGTFNLTFANGKKTFTQPYELRPRWRDPLQVRGFDESDMIYLLMPDRFSNGDPGNDVVPGMLEAKVDRTNPGGRHGGDLQGVIDHLGYIKDLGATSLWLNPVLVNDQPQYSYHGYAATDLYRVDPRFGGNEKYVELIKKAHDMDLTIVQDVIYNHVGNENFVIKDPVSKNWVHQWETFTRCNYRPSAWLDPYASEYDKKLNSDGWFDHHMPDLNQQDELLADYLIQNTIWWVEFAGVDALRIDTYPYPDNNFMNQLLREVHAEYPNMGVVGETWDQVVSNVAWFQKGSPLNPAGSELKSMFDFNLYFAIRDGLREPFGWTTGTRRIYYTLAQDVQYGDAFQNITFLDNHDVSRIYSEFKEDLNKWKQAVAMLFTMRGIPCLYYGTELLFTGVTNPDGLVRQDFPGGWPGDEYDKFTPAGRNGVENEAHAFVKKLATFRRDHAVLQTGRLMQFVPDDDVYVYFRYTDTECVMVMVNSATTAKTVDMKRFAERIKGYRSGKEIITGASLPSLESVTLNAAGVAVYQLMK